MTQLRVVLIKPSKYGVDGAVERFKKGFMPNATLYHIASLTPEFIHGTPIEVHVVDEYVWQDLSYLRWLHHDPDVITLLALVGVQSHQFHRALDLAAYAHHHCVIGGPHPMTCDTSLLQGRGVSFALAEAELIWRQILDDALAGELRPVYWADKRWATQLPAVMITGGLSDVAKRQAVYHRFTAAQKIHHMASGVDRLKVDRAQDYAALRRACDIDLAPLSDSIELSAHDENLNRLADWRVKRPVESVSP